jgi:hypothetical protein
VIASAGLLSVPALPGTHPHPYGDFTSADFFRPQWFVLATLAAYPLFFAARSSWRVAVPLVAIVLAQMGYVVHEGLSQMAAAGVQTAADRLWYLALAGQSLAMISAAAAGARVNLRTRRWERRMRRLVGRDAPAWVDSADDRPGFPNGFYPAG